MKKFIVLALLLSELFCSACSKSSFSENKSSSQESKVESMVLTQQVPDFSTQPETTEVTIDQPVKSHIGNNYIKISSPDFRKPLKSPIIVRGFVKYWFVWEGSFPAALLDGNNQVLDEISVEVPAYSFTPVPVDGEDNSKLEESFLPFTARFELPNVKTSTGRLIFRNDNESGEPQYDYQQIFKVIFDKPKI